MHLTDFSNNRLVDMAERCVANSQEIPLDLYYLLIDRGIDADAITMGETQSTAGMVQHSQD